ncbi:MAG TPA: FecR domain-containing protein [Mucilaginibacter sp.]|nr:FecR domain-containing protein [Mucilaginibacter sp.]
MSNHQEEYKQHILDIMARYSEGKATEAEIRELDQWYEQFPPYEKYAAGMSQLEKIQARDKMLNNINRQIYKEAQPVGTGKRLLTFSRMAIAALILVIGGAGLFYYIEKPKTAETEQLAQQDILPGGNKAVLTLASGKKISLTDAAKGNIARQAGITITKTADGQLVYEVSGDSPSSSPDEYNTIETPTGGQYQVKLPDGTSVWLNAASSLKYPASFAAKSERSVQLSGEAYFEVAKDKAHPFIVKTASQEVQVLGTHFNINAYDDETSVKTTLLEGSVKVGVPGAPVSKILKPGEQAQNTDGRFTVTEVNTDYAVAWKDGYFRFNDKTLETGMREIARWYNVEVNYKNPALKTELLAGTISKYSSIGQVLRKMELTGAFHFKVTGREITVE